MRTAIYLRQSLDRSHNELAVDRQREQCRNLASRRGWTDLVEFVDNDTSATTGSRPAYEEMLTDIEAGAIGAVVCYHLDRLHRQPRELEDFIDLADRHHVALATVTGEVDLSTDNGRLIARITGAVAKAEVERKSARQKVANRQRAKDGKAWVQRTFGYDGNDIVWDEATAIRDACKALLNGASLYGIAQQWNSEGIKTTKGGTWTGGTVRQVLGRARNAGIQTYDDEIIEGVETGWPAIVSRDTWDAVRAVLADPKRLTGRSRSRVHLLTGLAICGNCGKRMGSTTRITKRGTRKPVYTCRHCRSLSRDLAAVDKVVTDVVCTRLSAPDAARAFARPTVDSKALNAAADEYRALLKKAEDEYDEGIIDGRRLAGRIDKLQPKLDAVAAALLGANTSRKLDGLLGHTDAAQRFAKLPLDRQRAVIDVCATVTIERAEYPGEHFNPERIRVKGKWS